MVNMCSVYNCGNNSTSRPDLSYFTVSKKNKKVWSEILIFQKTTSPDSMRVCSEHFFEADTYMAGSIRKLRKNAQPQANQIYILTPLPVQLVAAVKPEIEDPVDGKYYRGKYETMLMRNQVLEKEFQSLSFAHTAMQNEIKSLQEQYQSLKNQLW